MANREIVWFRCRAFKLSLTTYNALILSTCRKSQSNTVMLAILPAIAICREQFVKSRLICAIRATRFNSLYLGRIGGGSSVISSVQPIQLIQLTDSTGSLNRWAFSIAYSEAIGVWHEIVDNATVFKNP